MLGYSIISLAVVMFGFMFLFNQQYEKLHGSATKATITFSLGSYIVGLIVLLIINKFKVEFTWFTLFIASLSAINNIVFQFCSLKSLGKINLSLYSVFSMLGGMTLPAVAGIIFFHESLTVGKLICFITILISLLFTIQKGNGKSNVIYYAGIFIFNGMSGVYAKTFTAAHFEKTSDAGYSILIAAVTIVISSVVLLFIKGDKVKIQPKTIGVITGSGLLANLGNFLLVYALSSGVPASAQYPFVTGGTMIVSTIICFFTKNKPSKKEIIAVLLSFAGIIILILPALDIILI